MQHDQPERHCDAGKDGAQKKKASKAVQTRPTLACATDEVVTRGCAMLRVEPSLLSSKIGSLKVPHALNRAVGVCNAVQSVSV
jgi:hypothetical protein